jgi:putative tryptophan/tyrosine transport system substrate-binding protein
VRIPLDDRAGLEAVSAAFTRERPDAMMLAPNATNSSVRNELAALAVRQRIPSIGGDRWMASAGMLMSYGVDLAEQHRKVAVFVERILRGAKPAVLPVEQPSKFDLAINRKTAAGIGLSLPQSLLLRADHIID